MIHLKKIFEENKVPISWKYLILRIEINDNLEIFLDLCWNEKEIMEEKRIEVKNIDLNKSIDLFFWYIN